MVDEFSTLTLPQNQSRPQPEFSGALPACQFCPQARAGEMLNGGGVSERGSDEEPGMFTKHRREKIFGEGRLRPLDGNAKARIQTLARALSHKTEKGKAYGAVTAKFLAVLDALLWGFHNAVTGRCFPSYERIADAPLAPSTVYEAIRALERVASSPGSTASCVCGSGARSWTCLASRCGACGSSGPRTPMSSTTRILLSPISRLEPENQVYLLLVAMPGEG